MGTNDMENNGDGEQTVAIRVVNIGEYRAEKKMKKVCEDMEELEQFVKESTHET